MEKAAANKKLLRELQAQLKVLQGQLVQANKLEGNDAFIDVKVVTNQARFQRVKKKATKDKAVGKFYIAINITAKQTDVFIPVSIASGKKTAGFMYQIEGTAEGSIVTADVKVRGEGVSQVTVGTLLYAKIPTGATAAFVIQVSIGGEFSKVYNISIVRLNYKFKLTDARYEQYLKEIRSDKVKFS